MENGGLLPTALLVTEVFTPAGHWSSYPSHRHDEDDFPRITYLEETYYHRLNPASAASGSNGSIPMMGGLDETMAVARMATWCWCPAATIPCGAPVWV